MTLSRASQLALPNALDISLKHIACARPAARSLHEDTLAINTALPRHRPRANPWSARGGQGAMRCACRAFPITDSR
eukprot:8867308-Pyramimonas_sp.AAC.1